MISIFYTILYRVLVGKLLLNCFKYYTFLLIFETCEIFCSYFCPTPYEMCVFQYLLVKYSWCGADTRSCWKRVFFVVQVVEHVFPSTCYGNLQWNPMLSSVWYFNGLHGGCMWSTKHHNEPSVSNTYHNYHFLKFSLHMPISDRS